jgi:hypothetical protein
MADLMAGPNAPLTKAFISCGWRCPTVDWLLDPSHDLADERGQQSLSRQLEEVIHRCGHRLLYNPEDPTSSKFKLA